jgi:hypothetical protein
VRISSFFLVLLSLFVTRSALAQDVVSAPITSPSSGRLLRVSVGPSLFLARSTGEDVSARLVAPGIGIGLNVGRRFRDVNALSCDLLVAIGPAPTIVVDGETYQGEEAAYKRIHLGVEYTHYASPAEGRFSTIGGGVAIATLENDDEDEPSYFGVGGYLAVGVGREWAVGSGRPRVGLAGRMRFESYHALGETETLRGVSLSLMLTVSSSPVGVGRTLSATAPTHEVASQPASSPSATRRPSTRERALRSTSMPRRRGSR